MQIPAPLPIPPPLSNTLSRNSRIILDPNTTTTSHPTTNSQTSCLLQALGKAHVVPTCVAGMTPFGDSPVGVAPNGCSLQGVQDRVHETASVEVLAVHAFEFLCEAGRV